MKTWLKGGLYGLAAGIITVIVNVYAYLFSYVKPLMKFLDMLLSFTNKDPILTGIVIVLMDLVILFITGIVIGFIWEIFNKTRRKNDKK